MGTRGKNGSNAIQNLHSSLNARLASTARSGGEHDLDIREQQKEFIEKTLSSLLEALKLGLELNDCLITVRQRFSDQHAYLRPVFAVPNDLNAYMSVPKQQIPFKFDLSGPAFKGIRRAFKEENDNGFFCLHKVNKSVWDGRGARTDPAQDEKFVQRVNGLWQRLCSDDALASDYPEIRKKSDKLRNKLKPVSGERKHALYCAFAGNYVETEINAIERSTGGNVEEGKKELDNIVAIYFVGPDEVNFDQHQWKEALTETQNLFKGLNLIGNFDSSLFELQGLKTMADLLPTFERNDIPRADKISEALNQLKEHMTRHLVGRPEWDENMTSADANLFYFTTKFERDQSTLKPKLEMYPRAYREAYPLPSLRISHSMIPSSSKFLLWQYLKKNLGSFAPVGEDETKLCEKFAGIFRATSLKVPALTGWLDRVLINESESAAKERGGRRSKNDCLYMVAHDQEIENLVCESVGKRQTVWEALNLPVRGIKNANNSLVAFVIEGEWQQAEGEGVEKEVLSLPKGMLVFESRAFDAFSARDIEALRVVARAFASLVRSITHNNASFDYRSNLAGAFDDEYQSNIPEEDIDLMREFVFAVRKIDGDKLIDTLNAFPDDEAGLKILEQLGFSEEDLDEEKGILWRVAKRIKREEQIDSEEKASALVQERVEWALSIALGKEQGEDTDGSCDRRIEKVEITREVIDFLSACTENFQWSAYCSTVPEVLGARADKGVPSFHLLSKGYSASNMFMANVQNELRQVVKLSSHEKLRQERHNYATHVRYKLVNSARMPADGFAWDGRGWVERRNNGVSEESPEHERYGALVSDLISGEQSESATKSNDPDGGIDTFLTLLGRCLVESEYRKKHYIKIGEGIRALFNHGTELWRQQSKSVNPATIGPKMRKSNRLPENLAAKIRQVARLKREKREIVDVDLQRTLGLSRAFNRYGAVNYALGQNDDVEQVSSAKDNEAVQAEIEQISKRIVDLLDSPPDLNRIDSDSFTQISHGDLNARNLTWSSALTAFLLIDFEHVGEGYVGFDRGRLWLNAINELYSERTKYGDHEVGAILSCVDKLSTRTKSLFLGKDPKGISGFRNTYKGSDNPLDAHIKNFGTFEISDDSSVGEIFFGNLLHGLNFVGSDQLLTYSFFCSSLKEVEYASRGTTNERVKHIARRLSCENIIDFQATDLHSILEEVGPELSFESEKNRYFRLFSALRLLEIMARALEESHKVNR